ncbi:ATP-dependent nuclease [Arthrobacter sp. EPSL27]|uniref:ATP-dependent nuclease n=1 Tax=Arthrobacter sp. EPSL27 TaxID=1745378 RepID=UPI000A66CA62|nr:AAA family ATPase [Arthrobacter sp. EPSL27]
MPGAKLTSDEKYLLKRWNESSQGDAPTLREIEVRPEPGAVGIRGLTKTKVRFDFPVSVLVGANGSGKSTLLALAALAFNGASHTPHGRSKPGYTFVDFFARTKREDIPLNIRIDWRFSGADELNVWRKTPQKWMHYERRPANSVVHVGLSRVASFVESAGHRREFGATGNWRSKDLDNTSVAYLTKILSRSYSRAATLVSPRYTMPTMTGDHLYSGFNMGTGESALLAILSALQEAPTGSLVLVEEIEMGIHAEALDALASVLVEVAKKRNLQIVCTSHSAAFIDGLPRESRVLVRRRPSGHSCITGVTTRTALSDLSGSATPELRVVCEDELARQILEVSLPKDIRSRIQIIPVGSSSALATAARTLSQENPQAPILIVWDSDVSDKEVRSSCNKADFASAGPIGGMEWNRLPGLTDKEGRPVTNALGKLLPPEETIRRSILQSSGTLSDVSTTLNTEPDDLVDALQSSAISSGTHHDLFTVVGEKLSHDPDLVRNVLIGAYARVCSAAAIEDQLRRMLRGTVHSFQPPVAEKVVVDSTGDTPEDISSQASA